MPWVTLTPAASYCQIIQNLRKCCAPLSVGAVSNRAYGNILRNPTIFKVYHVWKGDVKFIRSDGVLHHSEILFIFKYRVWGLFLGGSLGGLNAVGARCRRAVSPVHGWQPRLPVACISSARKEKKGGYAISALLTTLEVVIRFGVPERAGKTKGAVFAIEVPESIGL